MSTSVTIAQVLSKAYVPAHGRDGYGWRVHKQITWFRQPQKHTKYELVHANINIMLFWYRSQAKPDISSRKPTPPPPPSLSSGRRYVYPTYVYNQWEYRPNNGGDDVHVETERNGDSAINVGSVSHLRVRYLGSCWKPEKHRATSLPQHDHMFHANGADAREPSPRDRRSQCRLPMSSGTSCHSSFRPANLRKQGRKTGRQEGKNRKTSIISSVKFYVYKLTSSIYIYVRVVTFCHQA